MVITWLIMVYIYMDYLVGGIPTPLKKYESIGIIIPNI